MSKKFYNDEQYNTFDKHDNNNLMTCDNTNGTEKAKENVNVSKNINNIVKESNEAVSNDNTINGKCIINIFDLYIIYFLYLINNYYFIILSIMLFCL